MITIENSNIVNWDNYPGFICAIVSQTNTNLSMRNDLVMPEKEEVIWLLDKAPEIISDNIVIDNTKVYVICGPKVNAGQCYDCFDALELHFKPKPIIKIESKQECYA